MRTMRRAEATKAKKEDVAPAKKADLAPPPLQRVGRASDRAEPTKKPKRPKPVVGVHASAIEAGRKARTRVTKQSQLNNRRQAGPPQSERHSADSKEPLGGKQRSHGRRDSRTRSARVSSLVCASCDHLLAIADSGVD